MCHKLWSLPIRTGHTSNFNIIGLSEPAIFMCFRLDTCAGDLLTRNSASCHYNASESYQASCYRGNLLETVVSGRIKVTLYDVRLSQA